jgi:hypothetical protein
MPTEFKKDTIPKPDGLGLLPPPAKWRCSVPVRQVSGCCSVICSSRIRLVLGTVVRSAVPH